MTLKWVVKKDLQYAIQYQKLGFPEYDLIYDLHICTPKKVHYHPLILPYFPIYLLTYMPSHQFVILANHLFF